VEEYERRLMRIRNASGGTMETCGRVRVHLVGARALHIDLYNTLKENGEVVEEL